MNRPIILVSLLFSIISSRAQDHDTTIKAVHIGFNYSPLIFPESWRPAPINAYGEQLAFREIQRSKEILARGLSKYPDATLKNLAAVYFVRLMKFYDVAYGGTNSTDAVYLVNQGVSSGYTDKYLEQTFHHEFSSILFRNFPALLDTNAWKEANHPDFIYNDPENGVGAIRNNQSSQELDSLLCQKGVLTQYGASSIENDVNTFAQNLFCPDENFWKYVDHFRRIRAKTTLLIQFYTKINPLFTEQYFRKLGTQ
jgi:hypothetical protein